MEFLVKPIGTFCCDFKYKQDMPRQGVLNQNSKGIVKLNLENAPQCLEGLEGFSHIWLIYIFHQNQNWKPMVSPPRIHPKKVGVLASRAPYRPNQIGMSLVKLEKVNKDSIEVSEFDLLDQTPIIDIKPYVHYSDSKENSTHGWLIKEETYKIKFTRKAKEQAQWILDKAGLDFYQITYTQLSTQAFNSQIKRIIQIDDFYVLKYRTWRIKYKKADTNTIEVMDFRSGYKKSDLNNSEDKYSDKEIHKEFIQRFFKQNIANT